MGIESMSPQELSDKIIELHEELERVRSGAKEFISVRTAAGYIALGLIGFFHVSGWIESHTVIGFDQWLYLVPFFISMALLLLWVMHEGIQLDKLLSRKK